MLLVLAVLMPFFVCVCGDDDDCDDDCGCGADDERDESEDTKPRVRSLVAIITKHEATSNEKISHLQKEVVLS